MGTVGASPGKDLKVILEHVKQKQPFPTKNHLMQTVLGLFNTAATNGTRPVCTGCGGPGLSSTKASEPAPNG